MNYETRSTTFNPVLEGIKLIFFFFAPIATSRWVSPDRRIERAWLEQGKHPSPRGAERGLDSKPICSYMYLYGKNL